MNKVLLVDMGMELLHMVNVVTLVEEALEGD